MIKNLPSPFISLLGAAACRQRQVNNRNYQLPMAEILTLNGYIVPIKKKNTKHTKAPEMLLKIFALAVSQTMASR